MSSTSPPEKVEVSDDCRAQHESRETSHPPKMIENTAQFTRINDAPATAKILVSFEG
jgi:hypothetical protein